MPKVIGMVVAERKGLMSVKVLISNLSAHIELFKNGEGSLFVSSEISGTGGVVYFAITPSLLSAFMENTITLQTFFNESPSLFVEIIKRDKTALYSLSDIQIELKHGNKTIRQLAEDHSAECNDTGGI